MNNLKAPFTKAELEKLHIDFKQNYMNTVSQEVNTSYSAMHKAFEDYFDALQDDLFQQAFKFGYMKGVQNGN